MSETDEHVTPPPPTEPAAAGGDGRPPRGARNIQKAGEIGGPPGPEPTRYGDWEFNGRCTDF